MYSANGGANIDLGEDGQMVGVELHGAIAVVMDGVAVDQISQRVGRSLVRKVLPGAIRTAVGNPSQHLHLLLGKQRKPPDHPTSLAGRLRESLILVDSDRASDCYVVVVRAD